MNRKNKSVIREWIESLLWAAFIAFCVVRPFIVQVFKIPTGSMRPTLVEGDLIMVNKFLYGAKIPFTDWRLPALRQPKRGDVVVFIYPEDRSKDYIKRLIALPGESVEIKNGTIYINGQPLLEPQFSQRFYYNRGDFANEGQKIIVPKDSFFMLGDNSGSSKDSRYWGFVPHKNILGKAFLIYWPPQRIRMVK
ncbi:MAG: signal peptidase I [Candidatus Omnitrophota bacterium]